MYLPAQFKAADLAFATALMRQYPLATLVGTDDEGLPFLTPLPLHYDAERHSLWGHCARANPQWHYLEARPRAVVMFIGPQGYMSPTVYPDLARVPTWNYLAVNLTVEARLIHDAPPKDELLKILIADHEPSYAAQWRSLPEDYTSGMLRGIVGFELRITDLQCKLKLNQHRPEAHAAMKVTYGAGNESERALAAWMEKLGL